MDATVGLYSFQDVDLFREVLRGWDTEPTQLSSGRLLVRWDQLTFDDMTISRLRTNRKIADRTGYQAGHVGFVVCLGSKTFCGRCVNAGSLVLFGPGREYRNLLEENWESFEISMTSQLFRSLSFASEAAHRISIGPEYSVLPLSPHLVSTFRAWAANFLAPFVASQIWWQRLIGLQRSASARLVFWQRSSMKMNASAWRRAPRTMYKGGHSPSAPWNTSIITSTKRSRSNRSAKRWVAQAAAFSWPFISHFGLLPSSTSLRDAFTTCAAIFSCGRMGRPS